MKFLKPLMRTHFPHSAKYSRRRTGNKTLSYRATATTPSLLRLKVRRGGSRAPRPRLSRRRGMRADPVSPARASDRKSRDELVHRGRW
jgi:hypothetical protein